jgi:hypothetical protein
MDRSHVMDAAVSPAGMELATMGVDWLGIVMAASW